MKKFNSYSYLRYKKTIPFSERLNQFIDAWFETHKDTFVFTEVDDFNSDDIVETFERHKKRYRETKKIHVWTGESDNTIFGSAEVNHKFRAWHDYIHINHNLGYSITEESIVCDIQRDMLPADWAFENRLLECEIKGQAYYFYKQNKFINNQRLFTCYWLQDTISALNLKNI
ncbi:MAG: hypothetical protein HRU18_11190 [Pseudoalteromonas sp.]|uniref:hypothetical protein n=1 Tax=Pseudoalteromonas sp. TaxID=53249 RepID=UPI001DC1230E|nr:hypothetical protein [Pseudoalteromonas sp.]NRA78764.1 hypothetical protein [Pseudoalteromonas sp.]